MELTPIEIARFWSRVNVRVSQEECWLWLHSVDNFGYGEFKVNGTSYHAPRVAYTLINGAIRKGHVVRHKCDTPRCCNPHHLETGTHADNVRDRQQRNRSARGSRIIWSKLTEEDVRRILASKHPSALLAEIFGVTPQTIMDIRRGETWKHVA